MISLQPPVLIPPVTSITTTCVGSAGTCTIYCRHEGQTWVAKVIGDRIVCEMPRPALPEPRVR